jgi:hypothetical protein
MYAPRTLARLAAALTIGALVLAATGNVHAAAGRPLTGADFFSTQYVFSIGDPAAADTHDTPTVAGIPYASGIYMGSILNCNNGSGSLNMARFPGYSTFSAVVGIGDASTPASSMQFTITGDGKTLFSRTEVQGQLAAPINVGLGHAKVIRFYAKQLGPDGEVHCSYLVFSHPSLRADRPSSPAPPPVNAAPLLQLFSPTVAVGGQETALVTAGPDQSVTLVITYANGLQQVVGPRQTGTDGHLAYAWTIPTGMQGRASVVAVDQAGVARSTLIVG